MDTITLNRDEQQTVLAQLKASSPKIAFFVGSGASKKSYSREEMEDHVESLDEVGVEFIRTQMELLRAFKTGEFQQILASV